MIYTGSFRSVHRDKLYTIQIQTGNDITPASGQLTCGPNSFITNMDSRAEILYVPVKYQSANIEIVNDEYLFSLYSSTAKQNKVKLLDASNNVLFSGYTSPNIWDAAYNFEIETFEMEALDGLSILKYYDYTPIGSTKDFRSFAEIINYILTTAGCYNDWYFCNALSIPNVQGYIPNLLTISEQNFFDEEDNPMKMNEVLEEICRFCGVTAVSDGQSVYFIDYDDSSCNYIHYNIGNTTATGIIQLSDNHSITATDYVQTGSNLSLKGTFSKVTVTDSLYPVENIIPPMFEDGDLRNIKYVSESQQNWSYTFTSVPELEEKFYDIKYRSYTNTKYNHYYFDYTGQEVHDIQFDALFASQYYRGCGFFKYQFANGDTKLDAYQKLRYDTWDDYLLISNNFALMDEVLVETKDEFTKPFFMSSNTKFIFSGSLILSDLNHHYTDGYYTALAYFPTTDFESLNYRVHPEHLSVLPKDIKLRFGLSIGNYSAIDASTWGSGTTNKFYIPFCDSQLINSDIPLHEGFITNKGKAKHEIFFHEFPIYVSPTYYENGIKEEGFIVSCNNIGQDVIIGAKPKMTIYTPDSSLYNAVGCSFIKDFNLRAVIPFQGGKDENYTDTEYSYVINDNYVNELSDIVFKICTYDDKQLGYSFVGYPYNGNYKYVDKLHNAGLNLTERAENICCYRIVEQYQNPTKELRLNLFNDYKMYSKLYESVLDINCVISSISIDYRNDRAELVIEEKK